LLNLVKYIKTSNLEHYNWQQNYANWSIYCAMGNVSVTMISYICM